MALTLRKHDASQQPEGGRWVPIGDAAIKMGVNEGNLRRKCQKLQHDGQAKKLGGTWHIHESYHPKLNDRANLPSTDLEHLAELDAKGIAPKYIQIARQRRDILHGFKAAQLKYSNHPARKQRTLYLATLRADGAVGVPSVKTFYDWERLYREDGLRNLVPAFAYKTTDAGGAVGEAALDRLCALLDCGNRISVSAAIAIARGEALQPGNAGDPRWKIGSYRAVLLAVDKRRPKILRRLADKGERAARADCVPKLQRDFEAGGAGDTFIGDERTVDIWCRVLTSRGWKPIRPKMTAWADLRSRVIVGWVLRPHADSNTILAALKRAVREYGKPLTLRTDWGEDYKKIARHPDYRDFDGSRIGSILDELGIEVKRTSGPYLPWAKPIESFFKTMKTQLDVLHASFWGGSPIERHEDRQKYLKANVEKLPTIDELAATLQLWIDIFHATEHGAVDMYRKTPMQAMTAFRERPIARESDAVLSHLFKTYTGSKLVRRDGVRHLGRWFGNGDARLVTMQGQKVVLAYDVDDASRAMLCKLDRTPIFEIEALNVRGMSERELSARIREQRRILRPHARQAKEARAFILSKSPDELLRLRAAGLGIETNAKPPAAVEPASLRIRTGLEEALESAGPAPSDAVKSRAMKSGTHDDVLSLDELIDPIPGRDAGLNLDPGDDDGTSLADLVGESFDE